MSFCLSRIVDDLLRWIEDGRLERVKEIIEKDPALSSAARESDGFFPLLHAAYHGHVGIVEWLVCNGVDVNQSEIGNGYTAVYAATQNNHLEIVQYLVSHGADPNRGTADNASPLFIATTQGYLPIVEWLLTNGRVDVNQAARPFGATPLFMAAQNNNLPIVKALVLGGADVHIRTADAGFTPLCIAAQEGNLEVADFLTTPEGGAEIDMGRADNGSTPLFMAAMNGHIALVELLLSRGANPIQPKMDNGYTPLIIAAENGHLDVVESLVKAGVAVNQPATPEGLTPLRVASQNGHPRVVEFLLKEGGADVNQSSVDGTPLYVAAHNGDLQVVQLLVSRGANVNQSHSNLTPLYIASYQGHLRVVELLYLDNNALPPSGDDLFYLVWCLAKSTDPRAIKKLGPLLRSEINASLNLNQGHNGTTPLDRASSVDMENVLTGSGGATIFSGRSVRVSRNSTMGNTILHRLIWHDTPNAYAYQPDLWNSLVNSRDDPLGAGRPPLLHAAHKKSVDAACQLLYPAKWKDAQLKAADVNEATDYLGWTFLHEAVDSVVAPVNSTSDMRRNLLATVAQHPDARYSVDLLSRHRAYGSHDLLMDLHATAILPENADKPLLELIPPPASLVTVLRSFIPFCFISSKQFVESSKRWDPVRSLVNEMHDPTPEFNKPKPVVIHHFLTALLDDPRADSINLESHLKTQARLVNSEGNTPLDLIPPSPGPLTRTLSHLPLIGSYAVETIKKSKEWDDVRTLLTARLGATHHHSIWKTSFYPRSLVVGFLQVTALINAFLLPLGSVTLSAFRGPAFTLGRFITLVVLSSLIALVFFLPSPHHQQLYVWALSGSMGLFLAVITARGVFNIPFMKRLQVKPKTLEERGGREAWLLANKGPALGLVGTAGTLGAGLIFLSPVAVGWKASPSSDTGFWYELAPSMAILNLSLPSLPFDPTPVLLSLLIGVWFLFSGQAGYGAWLRRHEGTRLTRKFQFVSPDFMTRLPGVEGIVGLFSGVLFISIIKLAFVSIDCSQADDGGTLVLDADLEACVLDDIDLVDCSPRQCWTGPHVLQGVLGLGTLLFFVPVAALMNLGFLQNREMDINLQGRFQVVVRLAQYVMTAAVVFGTSVPWLTVSVVAVFLTILSLLSCVWKVSSYSPDENATPQDVWVSTAFLFALLTGPVTAGSSLAATTLLDSNVVQGDGYKVAAPVFWFVGVIWSLANAVVMAPKRAGIGHGFAPRRGRWLMSGVLWALCVAGAFAWSWHLVNGDRAKLLAIYASVAGFGMLIGIVAQLVLVKRDNMPVANLATSSLQSSHVGQVVVVAPTVITEPGQDVVVGCSQDVTANSSSPKTSNQGSRKTKRRHRRSGKRRSSGSGKRRRSSGSGKRRRSSGSGKGKKRFNRSDGNNTM